MLLDYPNFRHEILATFDGDNQTDTHEVLNPLQSASETSPELKKLKTAKTDFYEKGELLLESLNIQSKPIKTAEEIKESNNFVAMLHSSLKASID